MVLAVRGLAALVALELLLHTAATPISGSTKIERSSVSERTVVRPSERRVLFGDDSTCSTFCGAGRPCTAPCQQAGCSNCGSGGGGGGGGGSNRGNGGSSSSNSGGSTSGAPWQVGMLQLPGVRTLPSARLA